jgi:hypothetical protein
LPDKIRLPGVLEAQGYGDEIGIRTPWVLTLYDHFWYLRADYAAYTNAGSVKVPFLCQPPRHYLGAAWYQRDLEIPTNWQGKRVVLFLERPHWKTTAWLDDKEIGSDISLCTPHEYDFGLVPPGRHRLTIRVDNRMILPYRPDAHSVSDSLGSAWNGIAGKMELRSTSPVWIEDAQIFHDELKKTSKLKLTIGNKTGLKGTGKLEVLYNHCFDAARRMMSSLPQQILEIPVQWSTNEAAVEVDLKLPAVDSWDEFSPTLHQLHLSLTGDSASDWRNLTFGLREFKAAGQDFVINGRKTYLRGTHFGGDFPLTGHPPTDVESWKKMFQTCKDWGLNHMRFHSWCPPEAAFEAADELGFYLQVECGMWNSFSPGGEMEKMLYAETDRILRAYGNHPSFVLLSASNEAHGNWKPCLTKWVEHFRAEDPRRLYTPDTGWSLIDEPGPVTGADFLAVGRIGQNQVRRESGWFGRDYGNSLTGVNVPVVSHELGQWAAYPDFDVIKKFTGFMRPGNYEIFRDSAAAHGLMEKDRDFAWASGRFQFECYKEEIEANLRTPSLAGFQLLDLHDYTGQGTALVGLLDPFWEGKGYATPDEFKKFCNTVVPLARLAKRVFTATDAFEANVEVANFGENALTNAVGTWQIVDSSGKIVAQGEWPSTTIPIGKNFALGKVSADLSKLSAPGAYKLVVKMGPNHSEGGAPRRPEKDEDSQSSSLRFGNDWNFWLYPAPVAETKMDDVLVTGSWDEAETKLSAGGKVLFLPRPADLDWTSPPLDRVPIFWNRLMNPNWARMLGLWCDTNHPALAEFPTEANCDWQWTEMLRNTRAVNLDHLPRQLQPVVQAIDDWNRNWKLGLIFECRVSAGKLMVCSFDIEHDLEKRPVARQLRRSLLDYLAGKSFQPKPAISVEDFRSLFFDSRIMRKLDATVQAGGSNVDAAIDGDPNTFWSIGEGNRGQNQIPFPHELTVSFPSPVAMNGIVVMPRQNDRDHLGDVREYRIETENGDNQWQEIIHSELASTWNPQKILFSKTVIATRLKFTALAGFGNDHSTALAELAVIYAGPKIADTGSGAVEYKRVRSSSTDVDEGTDISGKAAGSSSKPRQ